MAQEDDRDENPEQQEQVVSRRKKWWIVGIIGAVLILLSVSITLFLIGLLDTPDDEAEAAVAEGVAPLPSQPAIYYPLRPAFVTNYDVRSRQRFLQVEMTLMLRDANLVSAIELHMPAIRNSLVMLFSGQLYEELQTAEGKELLRQQALFAVQDVLEREIGRADIEQVLFTSFVMQ